MNIVIDTNVYVSYLLSPRGAGAWLLALWSERKFEVFISPDLLAELVEVLNRPEVAFKVDSQRKLALIRRLRYDAFWVEGKIDAAGSLPDLEDDFPLISTALEAGAEYILTWDNKLLTSVRLLSPDQFIPLVIRRR